MGMSKAKFLPEELMIDIFYRLPVMSIGRCRCLSKHWRNFLSDPQFIKLHFNLHAHTQEEKLIIVTDHQELHSITLNHLMPQNVEIYGISRKLYFPHISVDWGYVYASCNGLVLVADSDNVQFLINLTTLKCHKIPTLSLVRCWNMYGLGYNVVSDDFKGVVLSFPISNKENKTFTWVYMYSLRKGLWEKLENSPYDHSRFHLCSGAFVIGALHWLARTTSENSTTIAAFDLSVDKFSEVPKPTDLQSDCFMCIAALKVCLCVSTSLSPSMDTITFWIMKEYGVKESWTKFKITEPSFDVSRTTLVCSIGDDDVLLDVDVEVVVYNMKENQRKDLLIDVNPINYDGLTFVDSLVSPYFGSETEGLYTGIT